MIYVYMLRNYALAPLPLSHGVLYFLIFQAGTHSGKIHVAERHCEKKLEVAQRRYGVLCLTLMTEAMMSTHVTLLLCMLLMSFVCVSTMGLVSLQLQWDGTISVTDTGGALDFQKGLIL